MNQWVRFFAGTPQRLLGTIGALLVLAMMLVPAIAAALIGSIIAVATPFIGMAVTVAIVMIVFRGMVGGFGGGKK